MPYMIRKSPNGSKLDIEWYFMNKDELVRAFGIGSTYAPQGEEFTADIHVYHSINDKQQPFIAEYVTDDDRYENGED